MHSLKLPLIFLAFSFSSSFSSARSHHHNDDDNNDASNKGHRRNYPQNTLLSCIDLDCPLLDDSATTNCVVDNHTLTSIGVAVDAVTVPTLGNDTATTTVDNDNGSEDKNENKNATLSWTIGIEHSLSFKRNPRKSSERIIDRQYYISSSSPSSIDLSRPSSELGVEICALFLSQRGTNNSLGYEKSWDDVPGDAGSSDGGSADCRRDEYLGDECTSALLSAAKKAATTETDGGCEALGKQVQDSLEELESCSDVGPDEVEVTAVTLTDLDGTTTPTSADDDDDDDDDDDETNCSPTVPSSSDTDTDTLFHVLTQRVSFRWFSKRGRARNRDRKALRLAGAGYTPILTVVVPGNSTGSQAGVSADLSCMRPVAYNKEQLDNMDDGGESAGVTLWVPGWGIMTMTMLGLVCHWGLW